MDSSNRFQLFGVLCLTLVLRSDRIAAKLSADCPPNTVEIVFTKNGILCATTSSVPELQHLSVDPKLVPELLGAPPVVQKMAFPVEPHSIVTGAAPDMVLQPVGAHHYSPALPLLPQPIARQPTVSSEFMARRLPLYNENAINQNINFINEDIQRRPDPQEDKRQYYQNMLWNKLRRDAFLKKLARHHQTQVLGVVYQDALPISNNQYVPDYVPDNQSNQPTSHVVYDNEQFIERPTVVMTSPPTDQPQDIQRLNYDQNDQKSAIQDQSSGENLSTQEPLGQNESSNTATTENSSQTVLKNLKSYLTYLRNKESSFSEPQQMEINRENRQYMSSASEKVPDIIRGYMPAPAITNGHTTGQKDMDVGDEPMTSQSEVNYVIEKPSYVPELGELRVVSTEMSFGQRLPPGEGQSGDNSFDSYKNYDDYQNEKARQMNQIYEIKNNFVEKPIADVDETYDEDVIVVTADPRQRQIIEKLEENQFTKTQHKTLPDEWSGFQPMFLKESKRKARHFGIDHSRIEYNGWKPLRSKEVKSVDSEETEPAMSAEATASQPIPAIVPIIGRVSDNWKVA